MPNSDPEGDMSREDLEPAEKFIFIEYCKNIENRPKNSFRLKKQNYSPSGKNVYMYLDSRMMLKCSHHFWPVNILSSCNKFVCV